MDSVLEEIILQITIKARLKGFRTFHPVDRISKLDLSSHIDGNWIFRSQIHFNNLIFAVRYTEAAMGKNVLRKSLRIVSVSGLVINEKLAGLPSPFCRAFHRAEPPRPCPT